MTERARPQVFAGTIRTLCALVAAASGLAGCSGPNVGPGLMTGFDFARAAPEENATLVSRPVLVFGDTHTHHLYGEPLFVTTNLADALCSTAIRPPQADLYGPRMLAWLLDQTQLGAPLIHLGDAADASCTSEFETFVGVMTRRPGLPRWFMAPGNHDGYFYGNSHEDPEGDAWKRACAHGSSPMTKGEFITMYLDALSAQDDPASKELAVFISRHPGPGSREIVTASAPDRMLLGAAWTIDRVAPWRSYLAQRLDLTRRAAPGDSGASVPHRRVIAILLDTSTFEVAPQIIPVPPASNAGLVGSLGPEEVGPELPGFVTQRSVVRRWAQEARRDNAILVLMGHHDHASLDSRSQGFLSELRRDAGALLYVSSHTHSGRWASIGSADDAWPELVTGSALDTPIELRELSFRFTDESRRLSVVAPLLRLESPALLPPECNTMQSEWEPSPSDADYPLSYKRTGFYAPGATHADILRVLLASYRRMFEKLPFSAGAGWPEPLPESPARLARLVTTTLAQPAGPGWVDLLRMLVAAEKSAVFRDGRAADAFRVCQVYWAGKYEGRGVRLPEASDWTILYPRQE